MKKTVMKKYASLIARVGANVQKGQVVQVNAAVDQAEFAEKMLPLLKEEEHAWFRRGKNAHISVPKSATREQYALATGLEALFGALYLSGRTDRLNELFAALMEE